MPKYDGVRKYHRYLISLSIGLLLIGFVGGRNEPRLEVPPVIVGAIIPHHEVAAEMMVDLGEKLTHQTVNKVVIVGPNHFGVGNNHIEREKVEQDHACTSPRTVLKKYLPKADFSCVLVSNRATVEEMERLVEELGSNIDQNGVLVASVDFSHYLPKKMADENDGLTRKYLENQDEVSLLKLGDHYLDSPKSIKILWDYLKTRGKIKGEIVEHFSSAQVLGVPDLASTTSYFEVIYR